MGKRALATLLPLCLAAGCSPAPVYPGPPAEVVSAEPPKPPPPDTADQPAPNEDAASLAKKLKCEERDSGWGCVDDRGEVVIPFAYSLEAPFSPAGICIVFHPNEGFHYLDATGQVLYKAFNFENGPDPIHEGRARFVRDGKIGFVGKDFTVAVPARFDSAMPFDGGTATVCVGCDPRVWSKDAPDNLQVGRVFHIDKDGREVDGP